MAQVSDLPPVVKQFQAWIMLTVFIVTIIFGWGVTSTQIVNRIDALEQHKEEISEEVKENRKIMADIRDRLIRIEADVSYVKERGVK